jgi:hypothetical protein
VIELGRDPGRPDRPKAQAWLERIYRETFGMQEDPRGQQAADPIERWGRFFGRALGLICLALLIANLAFHWFF